MELPQTLPQSHQVFPRAPFLVPYFSTNSWTPSWNSPSPPQQSSSFMQMISSYSVQLMIGLMFSTSKVTWIWPWTGSNPTTSPQTTQKPSSFPSLDPSDLSLSESLWITMLSIPCSKSVKYTYLGVTISNNLTWSEHTRLTCKSANRSFRLICNQFNYAPVSNTIYTRASSCKNLLGKSSPTTVVEKRTILTIELP